MAKNNKEKVCRECGGLISQGKARRCQRCREASCRRWNIEDIIEMRLGGKTYREIGKRFNICAERVRELLLFRWRSDRRRIWKGELGDLETMMGVYVGYRRSAYASHS